MLKGDNLYFIIFGDPIYTPIIECEHGMRADGVNNGLCSFILCYYVVIHTMVIRVEVMESNDCEGLARLKLKALQNIMQSITVNVELGLCN